MSEADRVRKEMAQIRHELHRDVSEVVVGASSFFDWRSHIAKAPWFAIASAFAVGYLIIPRKKHQVEVVATPSTPPPIQQTSAARATSSRSSWGMWTAAREFLWPIVVNVAQSQVLRYAHGWLEASQTSSPGDPSNGAAAGATARAGDQRNDWPASRLGTPGETE